jgi:hypothetical protein
MKSRIIQDQPDRSNRPTSAAPAVPPRGRRALLAVALATVLIGVLLLAWFALS